MLHPSLPGVLTSLHLVNSIHSSALTSSTAFRGRRPRPAPRPLFFTLRAPLFQLPVAVVTNYHKLGGLPFHSSGGQRSKISFTGLKSRCKQGWFLPEALRRITVLPFFQLLVAACVLWLLVPSLSSKRLTPLSSSITLCSSLMTLPLLPPSYRHLGVISGLPGNPR